MDAAKYTNLDAANIAKLVNQKETNPDEIWEAAFNQYLATNKDTNAIVEWFETPDRAKPKQTQTAGLLAGVPILAKDYGSAVEGRLVQMGSRLAVGNRAQTTAPFMRALLDAGAQIVGRTAVPEFIQHGTTESLLYGPTRNPLDLKTSAGGSSGGAGAAVASRVVPAAHASDCAGSIRIPAAVNGLYGLKPGRKTVPWANGVTASDWSGIAAEFMLCRNLADVALFLQVLSGQTLTSPKLAAETQLISVAEQIELQDDLKQAQTRLGKPTKTSGAEAKLRIAVSVDHWAGYDNENSVVEATQNYASRLQQAGHTVELIARPFDNDLLASTWHAFFSLAIAEEANAVAQKMGRGIDETTVEPITAEVIGAASQISKHDLKKAAESRRTIEQQLHKHLSGFDMLLTPTLGRPKIAFDTLGGNVENLQTYLEANDKAFPFSYLFNVVGWPSLSVPVDASGAKFVSTATQTNDAKQPFGVQLSRPAS